MVLRINILLLSLCVSFILLAQQNELFFTDNYNTNMYKGSENTIIFNNNYFALLDNTTKDSIYALIQQFSTQNEIILKPLASNSKTQFAFSITNAKQNQLEKYSKNWHQQYESKLFKLLNTYYAKYFNKTLEVFTTKEEAVLYQITYQQFKNYNGQINDFNKTNLNIIITNMDIKSFLNNHVGVNLSLKRIITNSNVNLYSEKYKIESYEGDSIFYIGVNDKSRLIDCFSMHLFCAANQYFAPVYFNNFSYFTCSSPQYNTNYQSVFNQTKIEFIKLINNPNLSIYTVEDKRQVDDMIQLYSDSDFYRFIDIYLTNNPINYFSAQEKFSVQNIADSIHFKTNVEDYQDEKQQTKIIELANFLKCNPSLNLLVIGHAGTNEYLKIDKNEFMALVNQYAQYNPLKLSKRAELPLFRALVIFNNLVELGIDPKRITCMGKKIKNEENENLSFATFVMKL